jgi:hypothetical protein
MTAQGVSEQLIAALASIQAVELKGLGLLRQLQPASGWLPTSADSKALAEAATELMDYMEDCEALARKVCGLKPVPLGIALPEYGL